MQEFLLLAQDGVGELLWGLGGLAFFGILLGLLALAIFVWALVDALRNPALDPMMKLVWVVVMLCLPVVGSIIYLVVGRSMTTPTHRTYG